MANPKVSARGTLALAVMPAVCAKPATVEVRVSAAQAATATTGWWVRGVSMLRELDPPQLPGRRGWRTPPDPERRLLKPIFGADRFSAGQTGCGNAEHGIFTGNALVNVHSPSRAGRGG